MLIKFVWTLCCLGLALSVGHGPRNRACKPLGGFHCCSNATTGRSSLPTFRSTPDSKSQWICVISVRFLPLAPLRQRCEAFFPAFGYHWLYASGAIIGGYLPKIRARALHRFHTGGSSVFRIQTSLPPSKLDGELEPSAFACSYQLLPPSGRARTEGLNSRGARSKDVGQDEASRPWIHERRRSCHAIATRRRTRPFAERKATMINS